MTQALVLLGGTFDPPHRAHLALLRAAGHALGMTQQMQLLIAPDPWQKPGITPFAERLAMLQIAVDEDNQGSHTRISINTFENEHVRKLNSPTYSIHTLKALRELVPNAPITFVLGWDQWLKLPTWQGWRELTDYVHLCIAPRMQADGSPSEELKAWSEFKFASEHQLREQNSGLIFQLPLFEHPESSTELRKFFCEARYTEASPWLHPGVLRYIQTHSLYQDHH